MNSVFHEMECLTEYSKPLQGEYLRKKWFKKADKRYMSQSLQKFIEYNREHFRFLGVTPYIEGVDPRVVLRFRSSEYIGAIPLRSPDTGKQIGDFVVTPRYSHKARLTEYIKILDLIGEAVNAEFKNSIPLISGRGFQPPLYYEAVIFVKDLMRLVRTKWVRFSNKEKIIDTPMGQVDWHKYIRSEFKIERRLKYPVNKNTLTELHKEYGNLKYVFDLCKTELLGPKIPEEIRYSIKPPIIFLEEKMKYHKSIFTKEIRLRQSDSRLVRKIKEQANKLLDNNFSKSVAWRVDFNDVYEKYVQYIFQQAAKELGGEFYTNVRIKSLNRKKYEWELKHLEPDGVYRKEDVLTIFIDAKYKSHLYNKYAQSKELKLDFRRDLHQIMAYASFSTQKSKYGFLCYPANSVELKDAKYHNPINQSQMNIALIGIPLDTRYMVDVKKMLFSKIAKLERYHSEHSF